MTEDVPLDSSSLQASPLTPAPRTVVSVFLLTCLQRTPWYPAAGLARDEDLYLARLLYTLVSACPANTHELHQLATPSYDRCPPHPRTRHILHTPHTHTTTVTARPHPFLRACL